MFRTTIATLAAVMSLQLSFAYAGQDKFEFRGLVIGQKATVQMVKKATGITCEAGLRNAKVCNGTFNIANTPVDANIFISDAGTLERIFLTFSPAHFDNIVPAFIDKYGTADVQNFPTFKTPDGQQLQQTQDIWFGKKGDGLIINHYDARGQESSIAFISAAERKRAVGTHAKASDL